MKFTIDGDDAKRIFHLSRHPTMASIFAERIIKEMTGKDYWVSVIPSEKLKTYCSSYEVEIREK